MKQEQERERKLDPQAWLQVARGQRLELIAKRDAKLKAKQAAVTGGERRGEEGADWERQALGYRRAGCAP